MPLFRAIGNLERRRAPRQAVDAGVCCALRDPQTGRWRPAGVRDISLTGIALLTTCQLDSGQVLTIELRHEDRGLIRKYLIEVRHSDICCPNDAFLHGCRFALPLRIEELRGWL